ncbi:MAG: DUF3311 domain-containing protein [Planctomycetaceae bacterium]
MKFAVWGMVLLLIILHHDVWNWENGSLILGFIPVTLAYHGAISFASAFIWWLATKFAWPLGVDDDDAAEPTSSGAH